MRKAVLLLLVSFFAASCDLSIDVTHLPKYAAVTGRLIASKTELYLYKPVDGTYGLFALDPGADGMGALPPGHIFIFKHVSHITNTGTDRLEFYGTTEFQGKTWPVCYECYVFDSSADWHKEMARDFAIEK